MSARLVMLAGCGDATNIIANGLRQHFGDFPLLLEPRESAWRIVRRRGRRLGYWTVAGQLLFGSLALPWLRLRSARRIEAIKQESGLDASPIRSDVIRIASANSDESISQLRAANPKLVVVNGTRILSRRVLESIPGRFVNLHAGITPAYRGCHGAYWAMATGHTELAGVTVHWIDAGIDTGGVLKQAFIQPASSDSFVTYPYLQLAVGLPLLVQAIRDFLAGRLTDTSDSPTVAAGSHLYYHPTLWMYLSGRFRGVK
jgi:folate-dependent phosphoribosylglycinamide formyltransferase PurN